MLLVLAGSVPLSSQRVGPISPLTLLRSKAFHRPFPAASPRPPLVPGTNQPHPSPIIVSPGSCQCLPPQQTISDQRVGNGRTWSGKLTVIPSPLLLRGVTESTRERHPPPRVLEAELEEGAGPEQGHHGQKRYKPLTLGDGR